MSTEGTEVFQTLKAALQRVQGTLADCQHETERLDGQMRDLLTQRGEALLRLATHYLPEISRPAIESTFDGIRSDLLGILAQRDAKRGELQGQLNQANSEIGRRNSEIDQVTGRLNEKVAVREQLEAKVAETLKGNAEFQERSKLALQAEEKLHRDEQRVDDMVQESAAKLPLYEKSQLFTYLYRRNFGTSTYKAGAWVKSLDRWVADMIDFPNARNGYEFLKKTPELVAAEVKRRRGLFEELMKQVEAIEKAEADKVGLTKVLEEGDALGTDRDRLVQELERLQQGAGSLKKELADLEQAHNRYHQQAIERFRGFLGQTKLALLQKRASQTPEAEDDAIVGELAHLDDQIEGTGPRLTQLANRRKVADRAQAGLDHILGQYRQSNYDSDRSYFEDFDIRRGIERLESGELESDELWRQIQSAQQFRRNWVETSVNNGVEFAASPAGRVILGAVVDIAGAAMREAAYRGVQRRSDNSFPSSGGNDVPASSPSETTSWSGSDSSTPEEGSFTTSAGF